MLALLASGAASSVLATDSAARLEFDLASTRLSEALHKFSEQTSLQLLYAQDAVRSKRSTRISGELTVREALDSLLKGTGLQWRFINRDTVAITVVDSTVGQSAENHAPDSGRPHPQGHDHSKETVVFGDVDVQGYQPWWLNQNSSASFGFAKPLLETPRSVSVVNEDTMEIFGLSAVEDLSRIVPGVYTPTRYGIQGSVDVRNVPADTYFRGMKRLTLQGHGRSVLAALDSIEVVGGPPSPLYGMGKIGGYTNVVPKSGRARNGKYLSETQGFLQLIAGAYQRRELSFGVGGPLNFMSNQDRQGGYYVYGLVEDSNSYTRGVPIKQQLLQSAINVDNFVGPFRLESGFNYQISRTSGAFTGRLTQELVDHDRFISGSPLVNLDSNGNGSIGYLEMATESPVLGNLSTTNQPLSQVWAWPRDAQGNPLPLDRFPSVAGIPESMHDYLQTHPEADPTGVLRAQGIGGPLPISGAVPVGMVLDPRTVGYAALDTRRSTAFEHEVSTRFLTAYADLNYDTDTRFTIKNQLFFDSMSQYKSSNQPFSQLQDVSVLEDKLTLTSKLCDTPAWLQINTLGSLNVRQTVSQGRYSTGDYNHRVDPTASSWSGSTLGMTANTTFASANENADISNDGLAWTNIYRTSYSELGLGALFDIDVFKNINLLIGGRFDVSHARNIDYAGRYNRNVGTAANPGAYITVDDVAANWDAGNSWNISVSYQLPFNIRPYVTLAKASIILDNNNNSLLNNVIRAGHIGSSRLQEAGFKTSWLGGRLMWNVSAYKQGRTEVTLYDDSSVLSAYPTATTTWGWQNELKWSPLNRMLLTMYMLRQTTDYTPNVGGWIHINARALGFEDVLDASGKVVYPAEAFLYGGLARIILPTDMVQYRHKQGSPGTQLGITGTYELGHGFGVTAKATYLSATCSGRLCLVRLPQSHVYDVGAFREDKQWMTKLDVFNATNEHYFRSRTGDTFGDVIAQVMPGRRWQLTIKYRY